MNYRNPAILAALLVLACMATPAMAQEHYSKIQSPPLPEFEIPEAKRVELSNGMTVFLIEDHELPLVEMSARVGAGSVFEPPDKVGLASITGMVMRTGGTSSLDGDALNEFLESRGAEIETYVSETSGGGFMSSLKESVDEILPVFVDVLSNPAFPEDKIDLARTQHRSVIARRNDDPQSIAFREFEKLVYGADSPYGRHTEYATIDAIERSDLVAFHQRFFHPNNTILGVWGDFDTDEMVRKLEREFATWPRKEGFQRPAEPEGATEDEYGVFYAPKTDVTQSTILMGHPGEIRMDHPDYFAVTVMNQVLTGFTGRLFQNVRDDRGLAYAVFGRYDAEFERPGLFYAGVMTKSETTVEGAEAVRDEIEKLREEPPGDAEIELAKDSYLNGFVFNFDTRREIVDRMMTYEYYDYPLDFLNRIQEGVQTVGKNEVHRVAQRYLKPDDMKLLVVGNEEDFDAPLSTLGDVTALDISIPTGDEPEPQATEETLSRGQEVLKESVDALGGIEAFRRVETAHTVLSSSVTTPDNMKLEITTELFADYPDRMRLVQSLPMGEIIVVMNGENMTLSTPQGTMDAPPPVRQQMAVLRWRDLIHLFASSERDDLTVQHVGQAEIEDRQADVLSIAPLGEAGTFRLFVDTETREPVAIEYQSQNMMTGAPMNAREVLSDYRAVEGIRLPFKAISYHDGSIAAETTVDDVRINEKLNDDLFSIE